MNETKKVLENHGGMHVEKQTQIKTLIGQCDSLSSSNQRIEGKLGVVKQ
jgi:hypothetical protein